WVLPPFFARVSVLFLASYLAVAFGPALGFYPARCPARVFSLDFGCRGRAASRRSSMGCARRNRNSRDGGGGRRRSRPRTPPAPPQAAWAPSTWVAAPLVSDITTRETASGSPRTSPRTRCAVLHVLGTF